MNDKTERPAELQAAMRSMIDGYRVSQLIYAAAESGIADLLKDGPRSGAELARAIGVRSDRLFRLLRAMAAIGIVARLPEDRFELTPLGELLRRDRPGSLRARALLAGSQHYPAWRYLWHAIETGEVAFENAFGIGAWEYRRRNPGASKVFDQALGSNASANADKLLKAFDFSAIRRVVDVGGGNGATLAAILRACPNVRGVLFDLEPAVREGEQSLKAEGLADRCEFVPGSFLEGVAAEGDCFILSRVLHNWNDSLAALILANCRAAMEVGQTLLVVGRFLDETAPTAEMAIGDLSMMVVHDGRERTLDELRVLLTDAGFEFKRAVPAEGALQIVLAQAV